MPSASNRRTIAALLLALALSAAACGGESTGDESGASEPGSTEAEPAGEVDTEATFIYAYPITVSRLDPHRASISQDATTLFPAYDRLVHVAPDGELIPGLAESWEFSEDATTLTLHLRDGVTFHDGAAFDAEAVRANLERAIGIEGSSVATDLRSLESVEVVDPMTVALHLKEANVAIIGSLADRAGTQVSPKAIADGVNLDEQMVGAGPYRMVRHTPGSTTIFERYDDYWNQDQKAQVAQLEIRVIADSVARLNALRTGEVHATTLSPNQVVEVENDPSFQLRMQTELAYLNFVQNRSRGSQDQLAVRQAMIHAIDREGICETLAQGYCFVTDQPFPPEYFAYNDEIDDVLYPYDPEKARDLLAEAGITDLKLSLLIPAGLPTYPEVSEAIQAQLAEVGIELEIRPAEPTQLGELMFAQKTADTMLATWGGRPDPAMTLIQRASSTGFGNPGGVTTPKMEELIADALRLTDPAEREKALQAGSREMAESALEIVVYFPEVPYAMAENVVFTPYLSSKPEFREVAITK